MEARNDLIELYFNQEQQEIFDCLFLIHGQNLSFRQLQRVLAKNVFRGEPLQSILTLWSAIQYSASDVGYGRY